MSLFGLESDWIRYGLRVVVVVYVYSGTVAMIPHLIGHVNCYTSNYTFQQRSQTTDCQNNFQLTNIYIVNQRSAHNLQIYNSPQIVSSFAYKGNHVEEILIVSCKCYVFEYTYFIVRLFKLDQSSFLMHRDFIYKARTMFWTHVTIIVVCSYSCLLLLGQC